MPVSISYEQAAFTFLLASPHTPLIRWDELVEAIKNGCNTIDPNEIDCYLFGLGSVPYQFIVEDGWIQFHPGTGAEEDYRWLHSCPTRIDDIPTDQEIADALKDDELRQLLDDIGGCHH